MKEPIILTICRSFSDAPGVVCVAFGVEKILGRLNETQAIDRIYEIHKKRLITPFDLRTLKGTPVQIP